MANCLWTRSGRTACFASVSPGSATLTPRPAPASVPNATSSPIPRTTLSSTPATGYSCCSSLTRVSSIRRPTRSHPTAPSTRWSGHWAVAAPRIRTRRPPNHPTPRPNPANVTPIAKCCSAVPSPTDPIPISASPFSKLSLRLSSLFLSFVFSPFTWHFFPVGCLFLTPFPSLFAAVGLKFAMLFCCKE